MICIAQSYINYYGDVTSKYLKCIAFVCRTGASNSVSKHRFQILNFIRMLKFVSNFLFEFDFNVLFPISYSN